MHNTTSPTKTASLEAGNTVRETLPRTSTSAKTIAAITAAVTLWIAEHQQLARQPQRSNQTPAAAPTVPVNTVAAADAAGSDGVSYGTIRLDVNNDGRVSPIDVLINVNKLNERGSIKAPRGNQPPFYDVDGDGMLTAKDPLTVINAINAGVTNPNHVDGASLEVFAAEAAERVETQEKKQRSEETVAL